MRKSELRKYCGDVNRLLILPTSFSCCFFPQMGYLIAVPHKEGEQASTGNGLTYMFSSNLTAYYKCERQWITVRNSC